MGGADYLSSHTSLRRLIQYLWARNRHCPAEIDRISSAPLRSAERPASLD